MLSPHAQPSGRAVLFTRAFAGLLLLAVAVHAADGERWLKVRAPEFTVVTSLREKEAVAWAGEFAQFVTALRENIRVNPKRLPPLTLVVFARERDFARFKPRREDGGVMEVAGFFSRRPSWAVAGLPATGMNDETRTTIFHEGTHWFLSAFETPNPVWLEEGLAEVFSTFSIEGRNVSWGRPIEAHVLTLNAVRPMPLERLLFLARDDVHGSDEAASERAGLAYAQSWAFVHYLLFGQREVPQGALLRYVEGLRTQLPDAAFREAFGAGYVEIDAKLAAYLRNGRYFVSRQPRAELPPLTATPAEPFEVDEALARLRIAGNRHDEARANVERAIAALPEAPPGYELLGELEQEAGNEAAARTAYEQAIARGSADFRPYYEVAALEHAAAASADGTLGGLDAQKARIIANRYERAINLHPRHRPAYQGLAAIVELVPPGNVEDVKFLELGRQLFPDDGMIRLGLAVIARRAGDEARARSLLSEVLAAVDQPSHVTAYARRLEAAWLRNQVLARLEALTSEKKFAEALALIDEQLKADVDFATRQGLLAGRPGVEAMLLFQQAQDAMKERRWADAREKLNAVLESKASPILKSQVRRQLDALGSRGLKKDPPAAAQP